MKELINNFFLSDTDNGIIQFIRYFFVGGIAAIINIGILFILVDLFKINYILSNIIGFVGGLLVNYKLSTMFVFSKNNSMNKIFELVMYIVIGILGLFFDTLILWIFTSKLKIYYKISKIISTMLTFIWNFFAKKMLYKIFK